MNQNIIDKIKIVADIVKQNHIPERQDKCMLWCYRNFVNKLYPMSERTFWRYISYSVKHLGYSFENENTYYLDDIFSKMKPETIEQIKEIADKAIILQNKEKKKIDVYCELQKKIGVQISYSNFSKYVRIAEVYLGYNFNFQGRYYV